MRDFLKIDLTEATRLTRAGRLMEATAAIQAALGGTLPEATAPATAAPTSRRRAGLRTSLKETLRRLAEGQPARGRPRPPAAPLPEGARFEARHHASPSGSRDYKLYVPANLPEGPVALVVMLHGCTQDPDDFAAGTGMNAVAERHGFLVAYPAQPVAANGKRCWNWFRPGDQGREGEPALIAGITRDIMAAFPVDPAKVFVAGLSAGGAAAAVMGGAYPELYAAVGVHSGLPVGVAQDVPSAFAAMRSARPVPVKPGGAPTIVFHGSVDPTVDAANGAGIAAQVAPGLPAVIDEGEAGGRRFTRAVHIDGEGRVRCEHWTLHGAGHAWSGGHPSGSYADPSGPDASAEMVRFFFDAVR